jgi:uncharacterized protein (DUF1697 family)
MTTAYVALLRGINVGKAKRVAMADLRALLADLGYEGARTLLNSGNIAFRAPNGKAGAIASRIEEAMPARLGVASKVTVLAAAELAAIVEANTLASVASNPSRLQVAVLANAKDGAKLEPLLAQDWGAEKLALGPRCAFLWCPDGVLASRLTEAVGRALGDAVTTRNWATITKLHALAEEMEP